MSPTTPNYKIAKQHLPCDQIHCLTGPQQIKYYTIQTIFFYLICGRMVYNIRRFARPQQELVRRFAVWLWVNKQY